jgi:adenylate cyclase
VALGATRIGLHAGPAVVGNFGSGRYFDYNAHGDTINTAARLEQANKQLGTRICVSGSVVDRTPDFRGRPVGNLILRGRHDALRAYEPLTDDRHAQELTADYMAAFARMEEGEPGALPAFAALLGRNGQDGLVGFHLRRLLDGASGISIALA